MTGPERTRRGEGRTPRRAWRLTFEYDASAVRLLAAQPVDMLAPPDDSDLVERGETGYWIEVRDARRRVLYRQVLAAPIRNEHEVFSPDPAEGITRVSATDPKGVFQVVVPDLPGGHEVVLRGRMQAEEVAVRGPKQLLRARLRERAYPEWWGGGS